MLSGLLFGYDNGITLDNILYCSFDICALLLIVVVASNYFLSKKVKNRASRLYSILLVHAVCATFADTLYLVTKYMFETPAWLYSTFNILFYLFYALIGITFLVYVTAFVYEDRRIPRMKYVEANAISAAALVGIIMSAVCLYGGFEYMGSVPSEKVYEYLVYGVQMAAMIFSMGITITYRKKLRLHHRLNVYLFIGLNILAAMLQLFLSWHLSCFGLGVADLLLYITLQRPEVELDEVSGVFNADIFSKDVQERLKKGDKFTVFACEINNMSVVNSSFGMQGGNQLIKSVAERIAGILPKRFPIYRLGGVKFACIFNDASELKKFEADYLKLFDEPFDVSDTKMHIVSTACRIPFPDVTDQVSDVEEIVRYFRSSAKTSDVVLVADKNVVERSRRRERVDYAIQNAIKNRTFEVYYQPIYSVKDGKINSCEALLRLNDPELGFISPDELVPIAEQTGRIVEVGKIVMEEVCKFLKEDNPMQYGLQFVDVNLSVIQCMHPEIIADIDRIMKQYEIPRSMVNLEVTETASAQSYALLQSRLNELHQSGFTISLDDFGTGFSSVEYLINFPFDIVKLDKSLVWAYMSTKKYEPILKHYMPMLHSLGTSIVAEGVETMEMVTALTTLGCDYLQGYYYSRPIPKDKFLEYLKENSEEQKLA